MQLLWNAAPSLDVVAIEALAIALLLLTEKIPGSKLNDLCRKITFGFGEFPLGI